MLSVLLPGITRGQTTDTLICDNGGFEDDFDYYYGFYSTFDHGSDDCNPVDNSNQPIVFTTSSVPSFRRFEIVSSGTDALVGINRTKFGSKSLLLNNKYGHAFLGQCTPLKDVNKITKRFKVTDENREFTIWFAAVLENPNHHVNSQPYFSITCDLAPLSDLCFDADFLKCADLYEDLNCEFDSIKVVDWTCHRVNIPRDQIGHIATIEITAADCGCSAHFGYAYIDGFCEECAGSSLGSARLYNQPKNDTAGIKYRSCNADTITICGTYTLPIVCSTWRLDSVSVPGFYEFDMSIDTINYRYCFKLLKSEFITVECRDLFVELFFSSSHAEHTSTISNSIEICYDDFLSYSSEVTVGSCDNNGTNSLISDDYYYVNVKLNVNNGDAWTIERLLLNPLSNESGQYTLKSNVGYSDMNIGPFLIQEGSWELIINYGYCSDTFLVDPPDFCGACSYFNKLKITDIICDDENPAISTDDTWNYTLRVNRSGYSGDFALYINSTKIGDFSYNSDHLINAGSISTGCIRYTIKQETGGNSCQSDFILCPPKSCSESLECNLEVYVKEYICDDEEFSLELEIKNSGAASLCYRYVSVVNPLAYFGQGSLTSSVLGPFTEDIFLTIYFCNSIACYKKFYVPLLNCDEVNFNSNILSRSKLLNLEQDLYVTPNPINDGYFNLLSKFDITYFEIFSLNNQLLYKSKFKGKYYSLKLDLVPGIYYLRYSNGLNEKRAIKIINIK